MRRHPATVPVSASCNGFSHSRDGRSIILRSSPLPTNRPIADSSRRFRQSVLACFPAVLALLLLAALAPLSQASDETAKRVHLLPHIADGDGWRSTLLVTNVARSASTCRLQLYGMSTNRFETLSAVQASGSAATFNLPEAGAHLAWRTRNPSALASGYATLDCSQPVVAQVVFASIGSSGRPQGMATVFSSQAGREFQFPVLTPQATLGFAIGNDAPADAACRIVLEDPQGNSLGETRLSVPSKANWSGRLLDRLLSIPPTFGGGTATVSCDQPVAVIGLHFELRPDRSRITFSTLPPAVLEAVSQASDETAKRVHLLPHIADGDGWQSTLLVTNVSRSASACRLQLHGMSTNRFETLGAVQASDSTATFNLPEAGAHLTWRTRNPSAPASGYATLHCSQPVVAQVLFASIGSSGRPEGMATVFSSQAGREFQFPVLTPQATLGFAIGNDASADAACRIVLEDPRGTSVGAARLSVTSKANWSGQLLDRLLSIPPTFGGGMATVSCDQPVAVVGLHFELQPDRSIITFSTLPPAVLEAPQAPQSAADRAVLEALYHATGGSNWTHRTNWLSAAPLAEWFGVGTDGTGRVTRLDLSGNGLSGGIPSALGRLSHLERLNLGWRWDPSSRRLFSNQLSGLIPPELGGLTNLRRLYLSRNQLSGPIPTQLGGLAKLQGLYLAYNQLSGPIPTRLGGLANLQSLVLERNQLSGPIPPELGDLAKLQSLDLAVNQLSGPIPTELGGLAKLVELELGYNQLSGPIPTQLGRLAELQWLHLRNNRLGGSIPTQLGGLAKLQSLHLGANQLSGPIPPELGRLANLQRLRLWGNRLSGPIPTQLGRLFNLRGLHLGFNPDLTGPIPSSLQQLTLSTLALTATAVCAPKDAVFQAWLTTIDSYQSSGLTCGSPPDAMSSIDVAVFYTPAARRQAGGTAAIETEIDLMVAETNQAYRDSGVHQQISLVAREEVSYTEENGRGFVALDRLVNPTDGYMDEVHAIRDRSGADLVHLVADVTDLLGVANDTPGAFSLTCATCPSITTTFMHELGHSMGLEHDRFTLRSPSSVLPYNYGYVNQRAFDAGAAGSARWMTIMAYNTQCGNAGFNCDWIRRFSNPNQTWLGDPLGVSGDERTAAVDGPADAARALNLTRHSVAAFRPRSSRNQASLSSPLSQARPGAGSAQAAVPVPGGGLFGAMAPEARGTALRPSHPATPRRREVSVDIGRLARVPREGGAALMLNLFDDLVLTAIIERRAPTFSGGYVLSGVLAGVPGGSVTLVVNGKVVAGMVRLPGGAYRIRPAGGGSHAIVQINPSRISLRCGTEP